MHAWFKGLIILLVSVLGPLSKGLSHTSPFSFSLSALLRRRSTLKQVPATKPVFVIFFLRGSSVKKLRLPSLSGRGRMAEGFSWLKTVDENRAAMPQQEGYSAAYC